MRNIAPTDLLVSDALRRDPGYGHEADPNSAATEPHLCLKSQTGTPFTANLHGRRRCATLALMDTHASID